MLSIITQVARAWNTLALYQWLIPYDFVPLIFAYCKRTQLEARTTMELDEVKIVYHHFRLIRATEFRGLLLSSQPLVEHREHVVGGEGLWAMATAERALRHLLRFCCPRGLGECPSFTRARALAIHTHVFPKAVAFLHLKSHLLVRLLTRLLAGLPLATLPPGAAQTEQKSPFTLWDKIGGVYSSSTLHIVIFHRLESAWMALSTFYASNNLNVDFAGGKFD